MIPSFIFLDRLPLLHGPLILNICKPATISKRPISDRDHPDGDNNTLKLAATIERIGFDRNNTVWDHDAVYPTAILKCALSDIGNIFPLISIGNCDILLIRIAYARYGIGFRRFVKRKEKSLGEFRLVATAAADVINVIFVSCRAAPCAGVGCAAGTGRGPLAAPVGEVAYRPKGISRTPQSLK